MSRSLLDSNIDLQDNKNKKQKKTTYLKARLLYYFDKNIPLEKYEYTDKLSCHLYSSNQ
jgi:hypothetical protein